MLVVAKGVRIALSNEQWSVQYSPTYIGRCAKKNPLLLRMPFRRGAVWAVWGESSRELCNDPSCTRSH